MVFLVACVSELLLCLSPLFWSVGTVETAFKMSPEDFQATYGIPKPALDAPELVFYCRSGKRSAEAISKVRELGYVTYVNKFC